MVNVDDYKLVGQIHFKKETPQDLCLAIDHVHTTCKAATFTFKDGTTKTGFISRTMGPALRCPILIEKHPNGADLLDESDIVKITTVKRTTTNEVLYNV